MLNNTQVWVFRKPLIVAAIYATLDDIYIKPHKAKKPSNLRASCGPDGTRTRDLRRDRAAILTNYIKN